MITRINKIIKSNKNKSFLCIHSDGTQYDFNQYRDLNQYGSEIYNGKISIEDAKDEQYEMKILINKLKMYNPTSLKKAEFRIKVHENLQRLYIIRNETIKAKMTPF